MNKQKIKNLLADKKNLLIIFLVLAVLYFLVGSVFGYGLRNSFVGAYADEAASSFALPTAGFAKQSVRVASAGMAMVEELYSQEPVFALEAQYEPEVDRKLVKNGSVSMVVREMDAARESINLIVKKYDGFVANDNFSNNSYFDHQSGSRIERGVSGNLTLRVPSASFDQVFADIRDVALVVNNENSNVNDVTERYTDLETRLKNKRAEESQYRAILGQATEVSDILEVTRYIEQARDEAERLQGQLNALSNQVDLSTIHVYLESEQQVAISGISWNPGQEFTIAWRNLLQGSVDFINTLLAWLIYLPLLMVKIAVYGACAYVLYRIARFGYTKIKH